MVAFFYTVEWCVQSNEKKMRVTLVPAKHKKALLYFKSFTNSDGVYRDKIVTGTLKSRKSYIEKDEDTVFVFPKTFSARVNDSEKPVAFNLIGHGNFNLVFAFSYNDNRYVIRIPIPLSDEADRQKMPHKADNPERVARIWNEGKCFSQDTRIATISICVDGECIEMSAQIVPFIQAATRSLSSEQTIDGMIAYFI